MTSATPVEGVLVPLVTPYLEDGSVDLHALRSLAEDMTAAGAGLVALATTGEYALLSADERCAVLEICSEVAVATRTPLIVGAGSNATAATVEAHAALAGVRGVVASLVVVPYYLRPQAAGVVAHFAAVAEASPVPVLAYNIPYRTGVELDSAALLDIAAIPNVAGVKQAVGVLDADTLALLAAAPVGFSVLCGDDAYIVPMTLMGAAGAIAASAHLATDVFVRAVAAARAGDAVTARDEAARLLTLVRALFAEPSPAVLKGVLHAQGRIATPRLRAPLQPASKQAVSAGLAALAAVTEWAGEQDRENP